MQEYYVFYRDTSMLTEMLIWVTIILISSLDKNSPNKVGWGASVMLEAMIYLFPWLEDLLRCFTQTMFQWHLLVEGTEFYSYLPGLEDSPPRDFRDHWSICNSPHFSEKWKIFLSTEL